MRVLVVAATSLELNPIKEAFGISSEDSSLNYKNHQIDFLVTGVGMVATAFELGKNISTKTYDLAINIGIAGAFDRRIALGDVVEVNSDFFPEIGAEDGDTFINVHELELIAKDELPFENGRILAKHTYDLNLLKVKGITVNKVHGAEESIAKLLGNFDAEVESMEGAAFLYACRKEGIACMQLRGISNYVEKRNKASWEIALALKNLSKVCSDFIKELE